MVGLARAKMALFAVSAWIVISRDPTAASLVSPPGPPAANNASNKVASCSASLCCRSKYFVLLVMEYG